MDKARSNSLAAPLRADAVAEKTLERARGEGSGAEKRRDVRYPVSAAAEIVEARSRTRLSARAADISLSGCYLDAINLFPVGSAVGCDSRMKLARSNARPASLTRFPEWEWA
jgi:hypothetical protein